MHYGLVCYDITLVACIPGCELSLHVMNLSNGAVTRLFP